MESLKHKHLTLDQRMLIQAGLTSNLSLRTISKNISKSCSTVSREIENRRILNEKTYVNKNKSSCDKLENAPFVCNGCSDRKNCRRDKWMYDAQIAHAEYRKLLVEARDGIDFTCEEFQKLDEIVKDGTKKGQSMYMIKTSNPEIDVEVRTLYSYVENKYLSISSIDLPRKVRFKKRKRLIDKKNTLERKIRKGRTFKDFKEYCIKNNIDSYVQMDTVEGVKGGHLLLTLLFVKYRLLLAYKINDKTANSVVEIFDKLKRNLTYEKFRNLFHVILTDNGNEFTDVEALEYNGPNVKQSKIFFCEPYRSDQKANIENSHTFIRRFVPKGHTFNHLSQEDINKMINNIDNAPRKELKGLSPYEAFIRDFGESLIKEFDLYYIEGKNVALNKTIFE